MAGVAVANTTGVGDHSGVQVKVGLGVLVGGTWATSGSPAAHPVLTSTASVRAVIIKSRCVGCTVLFLPIKFSPRW
jgi:hypothetical protein